MKDYIQGHLIISIFRYYLFIYLCLLNCHFDKCTNKQVLHTQHTIHTYILYNTFHTLIYTSVIRSDFIQVRSISCALYLAQRKLYILSTKITMFLYKLAHSLVYLQCIADRRKINLSSTIIL